MELDCATAKIDELKRELERSRTQSAEVSSQQSLNSSLAPSTTSRSNPPSTPPSLIVTSSHVSHKPRQLESTLTVPSNSISSTTSIPPLSLNSSTVVSPSITRRSIPIDSGESFLSPDSQIPWGRPSSPRHQYIIHTNPSSPRLSSSSYDYSPGARSVSPVPEGVFSDWGSLQRRNQAYEIPVGHSFRYSDDISSLRRRQQRSWNESDLDVTYEKKTPQEKADRGAPSSLPIVKAWKESSLDPTPVMVKNETSSNAGLRGLKMSSVADRSSQVVESGWRAGTGSLPRHLSAQQPISRIQVPPPSGRGQPHRPLPLSMIFKLQNTFWVQQAPHLSQGISSTPAVTSATTMPSASPLPIPVVPEWTLSATTPLAPPTEEVPRPLSPTRLQPNLPPSLADVQRVLEDIPRPLRRRGSQEHTIQAPPLPSHLRQYRQIMGRLFGRASSKSGSASEQPKAEIKVQDSLVKPENSSEEQLTEEEQVQSSNKLNSTSEEIKTDEKYSSDDNICVIIETSASRAGASAPLPGEVELRVPVVIIGNQNLGLRSALKGHGSPRKQRYSRARLDPLVLLLDAALTGEMEVVNQALKEVIDLSQPNEEGITALHNAICGANYNIANLLINSGANVNAEDSHGWTPLHCAASCNDLQICKLLVRHGAAIFATTHSDGTLAVEKCDPFREGYQDCVTYLTEMAQYMGEAQSGVIYALWDYSAEFADELSLREGDSVTVLRKDGEGGTWWWASLCGREGYVPRNYFGLYPRVRSSLNSK
ncbi:hypothetical protein GDO86_015525 [Hymenochirus boettgeri]|nr:hypothetical protein GDO86_015525 [Hymenochirus boettgeri]